MCVKVCLNVWVNVCCVCVVSVLGECWVCVVCVLCVLCCVFDCERVWGLAAAALVEGSDDSGGGAESKWTGFGSFRTGRLVRVSVCRPGPLSSVPSTRSLPKDPP